MSKMYVYSPKTNKIVAVVVGNWNNDREAVRAGEHAGYSSNDYGYSNTANGLLPNSNAKIIKC